MATGITLDDLLGTMQKAGIPMNTMSADPTYKNHSDRMMASRGQIAGAVAGTPPSQDAARQQYMAQIQKIAEMDQKLAGLYGNQDSNLFIEHAGQRENAIYGARPGMEGASQDVITKYNQDVQAFNQQEQEKLAMAEQAYNSLIEAQKRGEKVAGDSARLNLNQEIDRLLGSDTSNKDDLSQFIEDDLSQFVEPDSLPFTL